MSFFQSPPQLGNQFDDDPVLRDYLRERVPAGSLPHFEAELRDMGELAGGELYQLGLATRGEEPELRSWDAWGHRVEHIELTRLWQRAAPIAHERGLIATAYERQHGPFSRVLQMALVHLFAPSTGVFACPLAMTDGAAKTLSVAGNTMLAERALPRLTSRDPKTAWTSGQWMTERTGGSDVAISETVAKALVSEGGAQFADSAPFGLWGTKWFTSATTSQMALTLGRPEGNPPGGSGLALFYVETRDDAGGMHGIRINRLKEKLGTRMVPTAELTLEGVRAWPVAGPKDGIKQITPMLNVTRTWNSVAAVAGMRRAVALVNDYARRRVAFGGLLRDKPLHVDTLATITAESHGAFLLAFRVVELLGLEESGEATPTDLELLRVLTPIAKLTTGKQAVAVASEALEAFGGAGYIEDTGLPELLRDAQVLPIWEGTTNVLSLDLLRAISRGGGIEPFGREIARATENAPAALAEEVQAARAAFTHGERWLAAAMNAGPPALEAGARRLALTLGRAVELALLIDQARLEIARGLGPSRAAAAARRMRLAGVDLVRDDVDAADAALLLL